jgi:NADPH:quinone reductase-like Zn-dependent oxidoreductase
MRCYEVREFGLNELALVDRPVPEPGPGQVLVRMRAWSINYRDMMVVDGSYNPRMRRPMVPLSDGAGEVMALGTGATRFVQGQRVAACFMQRWLDGDPDETAARSALGGAIDGVAAEYVLFDQEGLVAVPEHLSFEEAASLPCAAVTAWHALVERGNGHSGETVLLQGTGGVSLFALLIARIHGARVILTSRSDEKLQRAKALGAEELINYRVTPEWDKPVRDSTGGRGVDHIVEVGGAGTMPLSLKAVRMGGSIYTIGVVAGADPINFVPVFMRNLRLHGIYVGSRAMFESMNAAFSKYRVHPVIDRVFPFEELKQSLEYMRTGSHFGKICLRLN